MGASDATKRGSAAAAVAAAGVAAGVALARRRRESRANEPLGPENGEALTATEAVASDGITIAQAVGVADVTT